MLTQFYYHIHSMRRVIMSMMIITLLFNLALARRLDLGKRRCNYGVLKPTLPLSLAMDSAFIDLGWAGLGYLPTYIPTSNNDVL